MGEQRWLDNKWSWGGACTLGIFVVGLLVLDQFSQKGDGPQVALPTQVPNTWWYQQRVYPQGVWRYETYDRALQQAGKLQTLAAAKRGAVPWRFIGPTNVGGRLTDAVIHPTDLQTFYVAAASGGVFKSTDQGASWVPIFDEQPTLSIGALTLDPTNPDVIYVGTGEVNGGGGSLTYGGSGVYKSTDAGQTWRALGLEKTRHIGRVFVDPTNPQRVFVAAMGNLFSANPERGLYRSEDGGTTWEQVLFLSDQTGSVDVFLHATNPDVVYTVMWQRVRTLTQRAYGGEEGGIFRSEDGGTTWTKLANGLPTTSIGRIGLVQAPSDPDRLYAIYADPLGYFRGFWVSFDGGDSWYERPDETGALRNIYSSFGWWFGKLQVHPENPDEVFAFGISLLRSDDGGESWSNFAHNVHVDHHALFIHPLDPNVMLNGNDGGAYLSTGEEVAWRHLNSLPITQFYTVDVNPLDPTHVAGGTQDNNTVQSRMSVAEQWTSLFPVGDGQYVRFDPSDEQVVYASFQRGSLFRSLDGGQRFSRAMHGIGDEPVNWSAPIELDPANPGMVYTGTTRVYRSTDRAASWQRISPVLPEEVTDARYDYGTITTLAVAPTNADVIYAGTDDGLVWNTRDGGQTWTNLSEGLPDRWITRVMVAPDTATTAYVTFSGFREDMPLPHVFRTQDAGQTWEDISGNLPEAPVNDIIPDPERPGFLYVATDVGMFYATTGGRAWLPLGTGLPRVPITDLSLHAPTSTLVAATYGRSMFAFDLNELDGQVTHADPIRDTLPLEALVVENFPNPFAHSTTIRFELPTAGDVQMEIYDVAGRKRATLLQEWRSAGTHDVVWMRLDAAGQRIEAGRYFCRIRVGDGFRTHPLIVVR